MRMAIRLLKSVRNLKGKITQIFMTKLWTSPIVGITISRITFHIATHQYNRRQKYYIMSLFTDTNNAVIGIIIKNTVHKIAAVSCCITSNIINAITEKIHITPNRNQTGAGCFIV